MHVLIYIIYTYIIGVTSQDLQMIKKIKAAIF